MSGSGSGSANEREDAGGRPADKHDEPSREEEAFVRALIARGEAAKAVDGKLPPGATHEIVEERPGRVPKVVRRRYSR
jgi:hypothetical protein